MCLSIPAKIVEIDGKRAVADCDGNRIKVNVSLLKDIRTGDYVLVHAGFAIQKYDPADARQTLAVWEELKNA
jgi:hydrogenase expression/formation protein HypC